MQGLIPRHFIDELLAHTDIVELIDGYVPLKKRGNSHVACCPFHHEKTPSFNVVAKKQFYYCFGCGASGNAISFIMNHLHLNFSDAIDTLSARIGMTVPREKQHQKNPQQESLYQLLARVCVFYQQCLKQSGQLAVTYLKERQIEGKTAQRFQLGYAPAGWHHLETAFSSARSELIASGMLIETEQGKRYDRYRQRIMFPIHDRHGRIIGFGGRAIEATQKPKYLNSPETAIFQKSRELYGLYQTIQQQKNPEFILVVEGYLDVIALSQYDIHNAVATLGTATSAYHIQLLCKYTRHLVFCFDGDDAGKNAALRALDICLTYVNKDLNVGFVLLPQEHDPDSFVRHEGREAFLMRVKKAIPLHQFLLDSLLVNIDMTQLAGKSQLISKMKPYLQKMPEGPFKQLMIEELARMTHVESHRLLHLLNEEVSNEAPSIPNNITRTPLRVATALLLQNPDIYKACMAELSTMILDDKEHHILIHLMHYIKTHPDVSTAGLVEQWRDSPLFDAINKLAAWEHQVPEDALAKEFLDIIHFLSKQRQEMVIVQLIDKARQQGLSTEERQRLQGMLADRHKS